MSRFQKERPLLALVDGNPMCAENKFCQVEFLSLKTAKTVYTLKYNEPVMDLSSTNNAFIVVLSESIIVYNNDDFTELCSFMVPPSSDPSMPPVYAVSDCFLAFVDSNVRVDIIVYWLIHSFSAELFNSKLRWSSRCG